MGQLHYLVELLLHEILVLPQTVVQLLVLLDPLVDKYLKVGHFLVGVFEHSQHILDLILVQFPLLVQLFYLRLEVLFSSVEFVPLDCVELTLRDLRRQQLDVVSDALYCKPVLIIFQST